MAKQAKKVEKMDLSSSATNWNGAGFDLKRMADLAVKFPIGARVKYVGTRGSRGTTARSGWLFGTWTPTGSSSGSRMGAPGLLPPVRSI